MRKEVSVKVIPAFWDEELEWLASQVQEVFGDDALDLCVDRATRTSLEAPAGSGEATRPGDKFRDILKAELHRRMRPH
jgi:hypothetical protein